jgi:hypothetical protein
VLLHNPLIIRITIAAIRNKPLMPTKSPCVQKKDCPRRSEESIIKPLTSPEITIQRPASVFIEILSEFIGMVD